MAFPSIALAIAVAAALGPSDLNVVCPLSGRPGTAHGSFGRQCSSVRDDYVRLPFDGVAFVVLTVRLPNSFAAGRAAQFLFNARFSPAVLKFSASARRRHAAGAACTDGRSCS